MSKPEPDATYLRQSEARERAHAALSGKVLRHRKGGEYTVLGVSLNSENLRLEMVYVSHATGEWWTRPLEEVLDGRFTEIAAADPASLEAAGLEHMIAGWAAPRAGLASRIARSLSPAQRRLVVALGSGLATDARHGWMAPLPGERVPAEALVQRGVLEADRAPDGAGSKSIRGIRFSELGWRVLRSIVADTAANGVIRGSIPLDPGTLLAPKEGAPAPEGLGLPRPRAMASTGAGATPPSCNEETR